MSSSNSEKSVGESEAVDKHVEHPKLKKLKSLRENYNWGLENHRIMIVHEFLLLIKDWKEQLPNLRDIFTKQEMDWILTKSIKSSSWNKEIVEFVIRSGYKDEPDVDEVGKPLLCRTTAVHQIDECNSRKSVVLIKLFEIYDKFHVNYTDESGYTHFYIACKYGLDDVAEKFLELGQVDPNCLVPETGDSLLYFVVARSVTHDMEPIIRLLLKHGANPRLANKDGSTPLHVISQYRDRYNTDSVILMLFENVDELQQTVLIDAQDNEGNTPLLLALKARNNEQNVRDLLSRGANPSLANAQGLTPLHVICQRDKNCDLLETFFKFIDEFEKTVQIDARDSEGNTPLHLAILCGDAEMILSLLRRGANPCLANVKGQAPLHIICQRYENGSLLQLLFEVCDEKEKTVQIDAQDNEGNTPLHLAISCGDTKMVESLLRRGANPCLANAEGLTPLLITAKRDVHSSTMELFFGINEERQWTVGIDARDAEGRTALEWAVARCWLHIVKSLLDRGANVSGFVFPTPTDSDRHWDDNRRGNNNLGKGCTVFRLVATTGVLAGVGLLERRRDDNRQGNNDLVRDCTVIKLEVATGLLAGVELLATRGYEMGQDDALKLMGFFDKYGLFGSTDSSTTKDVDDLVDLVFEEMAKNPTYMDIYKFASSYELPELPQESREACSSGLCEKVLTKFCRDWALDPFMQLIHYRLPIECCGMIMETLKNKDLFNICLAAAGRSSRQ